MKKILFALFATGILAFAGCEKEPIPSTAPEVNLSVDETPQSLIDTLGTVIFDNPITSEVTASTEATILDYPLFLDYDPFTMVVSRGKGDIDSCVKNIETTKAEKELLNKAFLAKLDCQKANKETIAKINREFEYWAKNEKASMYKKYLTVKDSLYRDFQTKVAYVNGLYAKGTITLEQKQKSLSEIETKYKSDLSSLEKSYTSGLSSLNSKLKEKLKTSLTRAEACGKIKDCEKIYLDRVLEILGKERFKKWIECYKYNYKKK